MRPEPLQRRGVHVLAHVAYDFFGNREALFLWRKFAAAACDVEEQRAGERFQERLRLGLAVGVLDDHHFEQRADGRAFGERDAQEIRRVLVAARLEEEVENGGRRGKNWQEIAVEELFLNQHADDDGLIRALLPQRVAAERLADMAFVLPCIRDGRQHEASPDG